MDPPETSDVLDPARHLSGQEGNAKQQPGIGQKVWNAIWMNNVPANPSFPDYVKASGQQGQSTWPFAEGGLYGRMRSNTLASLRR